MGRGEGTFVVTGCTLSAALLAVLLPACSRPRWDEGGVVAEVNGYEITLARFQEFYLPRTTPVRSAEEELQTLNERLDQLIGYTLIQETGRRAGLLKEDIFHRQYGRFETDFLNRLFKQREIAERVVVDEAEVQQILERSIDERHFQHIVVLAPEAAAEVREQLLAGDDWSDVAVQYSRDNEVVVHRGDLGWLAWGEAPLALYPEMQELAYRIPVGSWEGPIQQGGEYHFLKVLENRPRSRGTPEEEYRAARDLIYNRELAAAEQEFSNTVWADGGFRMNEDQFRWLHEQIQEAFTTLPAFNAVPELTREDNRRIVISSRDRNYTAGDLLERLAQLNPQERDNAITLEDWRDRFIDWAISDFVAGLARDRKLHRTREYVIARRNYVDSYLYSNMVNRLQEEVAPPGPADVEAYYDNHPDEFNLPERRRFVEVLLATREEAEDILRQARAGTEMEQLAYHHTIRREAQRNFGRFAPIRREEFGALGEAVFRTPVGEIGEIVETPLGFSVFQVTAVHPPEKQELEAIRDRLATRLHETARRMVVDSFREETWRRARIEKNMELLRTYAEQVAQASREAAESSGG